MNSSPTSSPPEVRIGCSGWNYAHWRELVYRKGLPPPRWLEHYATLFDTVEVNSTFYRLAKPDAVANWLQQTPENFVFAVKASRYMTHMKRLGDLGPSLQRFYDGIRPLADSPKLGPVLWQLPERLTFDADVLDGFLGLLPRTTREAATLAGRHDDKVPEDRAVTTTERDRPVRHALEFRSPTFVDEAAYELLRTHGVACVVADTAGRWPKVLEVTSDMVYVRLHGDRELYVSGYSPRALDEWAERCRAWVDEGLDVYVYFDNDVKGHAPHDAVALLERLS